MEQDRSNQPSNKEKAEGSRENLNTAESREQGSGPSQGAELPPESFDEGGGVSNRPIEEETRSQERVPERGGRKDVERESVQENPTLPGDEATTRTEI